LRRQQKDRLETKEAELRGNPSFGLSVRRNFTWTAAASIIYAVSQWGIIAALAKLGSPEMVGQFALGLAITAPIALFFQLQLRGVLATDAANQFQFTDYFNLRIITTTVALILSVLLSIVGHYSNSTALVISLIALGKAFDAISDIYFGAFQRRERMDLISKGLIANGISSLILSAALVGITGSVVLGAIGYLGGSLLSFVAYVLPSARLERLDDNMVRNPWVSVVPSSLLRLFRLALPLGVVMLFVSLTVNVPRYFIERNLGVSEVGVFSALTYFTMATSTMVAALGQAVSPRLARYFACGDITAYISTMIKLVSVGIILGLSGLAAVLIAGGEILSAVYTEEYAQYADVLIILIIAGALGASGSFLGYGMTAARQFDVQAPLFVVVFLTSLIASITLIPLFGLVGAAWSAVAASLVQLVGSGSLIVRAISRATGEQS
jgi:O-antigen/teichoic acid export membrane protein